MNTEKDLSYIHSIYPRWSPNSYDKKDEQIFVFAKRLRASEEKKKKIKGQTTLFRKTEPTYKQLSLFDSNYDIFDGDVGKKNGGES